LASRFGDFEMKEAIEMCLPRIVNHRRVKGFGKIEGTRKSSFCGIEKE
jgi:hypothetical protein